MVRKNLIAVVAACVIGLAGASQAKAGGPPCGHGGYGGPWGGVGFYPAYPVPPVYGYGYRPYVRPYYGPAFYGPGVGFQYGSGCRGSRGGIWIGF